MKWTLHFTLFILPIITVAQSNVLLPGTTNLRNGKAREWVTSPAEVSDSSFNISFDLPKSRLFAITQYDVNHDWRVMMNGKDIGALIVDEQKMVTYFPVPERLLKEKNNVLAIRCITSNAKIADDITIGNIILYDSLPSTGKINITVSSDDPIDAMPSRITILNEQGALQPVQVSPGDTLAVRSGIIYSGTGNYSLSIPTGTYRVYVSRGFEYGVDSAIVNVNDHKTVDHHFLLAHEVKPVSWKSIDTHVHTLEYSGHGDASMKERILTIAGEGLDYAVITEHNKAVDINATVKNMKMDKWFTPIRGDELTTKVGHFNIFPMKDQNVLSPDGITWKKIAALKKEGKVVILNHARDEHNAFRPADSIFHVTAADFPSNAMEVMNSGSQQTDPRQLYRDWMQLMNSGVFLSAIGSSDSHDVSRFIVGQSRTYVSANGDLFKNMIAHRTVVSFGLFTELMVENDTTAKSKMSGKTYRNKKIPVTIKVYHPSWVAASNVSLYADGKKIYSGNLTNEKSTDNIVVKKIFIPRPARKTTFVAIAEGPDPKVPWWPVAKPYQHSSPELNPIVLGISAPVSF